MSLRSIFVAGVAVVAVFAFLPFACAAENQKGGWQPELRVGLFSGQKTVSFHVNKDCDLSLSSSKKSKVSVGKGETVTVNLSGKGFQVKGKNLSGELLELRTPDPRDLKDLVTTVNGKQYRGGLQLLQRGGGMTVINIVPSEQYLRGVLPEEMPPSWPKEAVKSQAVAARTFALKNRKRHESEGYDLCSTTHCQLYTGMAEEDPDADAAIKETYGEVLFSKLGGSLIDAPFHTDSGGMTENSEEVWGNPSPHLRAAKELQTGTQPWSKSVPLDVFQSKFDVGSIKKIELSPLEIGKKTKDRTTSGRVKTVCIVGSKGSKIVSGTDMRSLFGLKSTLFSMKLSGKQVTFSGFGWGHGIGMSQWGAKAFAERGDDYKKILAHYYQNIMIKKLY